MSKRNAIVKQGPAAAAGPKTYDIVIRVSRRQGREGDRFMSPVDQENVTRKWIGDNGHQVGEVWDESDSVSGRTVEREGLQAALKRALDGDTDGIVVAKVDRFSRNLEGGLKAVKQLDNAGRDFIAVNDGLTGGAAEARNPTAKLIRGMLFLMAEWLFDSLSVGWESTREAHIARGVHPTIPYGYRRANGRGSKLVPDESEAPWVRAMFEQRAAGASWTAIAEWLNEQGVRTREVVDDDGVCTRGGARWTHKRVDDIIAAKVYLGVAYSGEFVNEHAHEPLVAAAVWEQANDTRRPTNGDKRVSGEYLLRSVVRCASCGTKMSGVLTRKGTDQRRYRCKRRFSWGNCPDPVSVDAHEVEALVEDEFFKRYVNVTLAGGHDEGGAVSAAEAELEDALLELRSYRDNESARAALSAAGPGMFEEGVTARAQRVAAAREAVSMAKAQATGVLVPDDLADNWDTLSTDERRGLVAAGFDAIMVKQPAGIPIAERVLVFPHGEAPDDLPGKGGGAGMRPVDF